ncbi:polysaccharide pyruvyl transferase family protein [Paracoccus sp. CPCC 101403]|uniref:Polysaccharide pyruvyl transferase family protein n=1 Tax=Paracoccus broussonetiae TaxID=3075834 RepID=A0ABU3EE19_9RHOB|nr:polysaccharide pyruvyl transferase family protein [Paracoccus sp. CPCC 101403]MDT1062487.1 polysaccharide pyruvyl transferase family protein [Paracoccus sp. CPCC 101403]
MSDAKISPEKAEELTAAVIEALASTDLGQHLKRIWVFQKRCLVVDFAYRRIGFGFDLTLPDAGGLSVALVRRGNPQMAFSVTGDDSRKLVLTTGADRNDAIAALVDRAGKLTGQIDAFRATGGAKQVQPEALPEPKHRRKVGILTLPLSKNYGGNLQALALMQVLRDLDCDPVLINRRYAAQGPAKSPKDAEVPAITNRIEIETECQNSAFIERHVLPITRTFRNSAELRARLGDYGLDAVIAGSDQVWRPKYARGILADFFHGYLDPERRDIRRISYAASFGADSWEYDETQTRDAARRLALFDAVSVREDSAVALCRDNLGVEARHVLDPTLLLPPERYRSLFADRLDPAAGRRITSYILDPNPEKSRLVGDIAKRLAMDVKPATGGGDKSVEAWLMGFYQADFVVTDSFHGVAFSIIFNKPFIAFANPNRGMARFTSILRAVGLQDRLIVDAAAADSAALLKPIDWLSVNRRLDELRESSIGFLRDALALADTPAPKPPKARPETVPTDVPPSARKPVPARPQARIASANPLKVMCTGCGVCVSESQGSLAMAWDKEGFWSPRPTGKQIPAEAVRVCPFNPTPEPEVRDEDALGRIFHGRAPNIHQRGGHFENSYIGHSNAFRPSSSSGGVATYVFQQLLRRAEVDYLYVVQGDAEGGYRYAVFRDEKAILSISKTRYFPVTMDELFSIIQQTPGRVAVSGVACFVKAIRLKQHYHPELRERIRFLVGIICGGLKSRHYTDFLAQSAGIQGSYTDAQYRVKNPEGEANDYFFSASDQTLRTRRIRMRRLGDMWGSGLFKNKACDFCTDVLTELADISLGDAWIPEYNRDGMGTSVVVTRNPLADRIIRDGIAAGELTMETAPIDLVLRSQSGGLNHKMNALKFRLWTSRKFTDLPIPACRTRVEKEVAAADMLVQVLRERVRANSLRLWPDSGNAAVFNRRMRSSRERLQAVTTARKKQSQEIYDALLAALVPASGPGRADVPAIATMTRWLRRKLRSRELDLAMLEPLLPETQRTGVAGLAVAGT